MRRLGPALRSGLLALVVGCGSDPIAITPPPPPPPPPPPAGVADLTRLVDSVRQAHGLPAMGGAIVTASGLTAIGVAGTRRATGGAAVTVNDRWHLGSNLKAMTAALAAITVDQGRIRWTRTIAESFPELAATLRPEHQHVTLEDLLAHRGGIRNDPPAVAFAGTDARAQRESAVRWALENPGVTVRGTFYYSNLGYLIAGAMVERAWNGVYEDLIRDRLWTPVGALQPGWGPQAAAGASDQPVAHSFQGSSWVACEGCDNPPGMSAAGRAHMPLADWARVIQELLRADAGTSTLISAVSGRKLTTAHVLLPASSDGYALGWIAVTRSWAGGRAVAHDGSNTINHSVAWLALGRGFALLATTNAADLAGGRTSRALDGLVGRLITFHETAR